MKKEQKITELRRAAKLKVAEIETKIAIARNDSACIRADIMWERAAALDGLKAGSTKRFDVLAVYRAKLADENKQLESEILQLKLKIHKIKSECEKMCLASEDDPEPAKEQQQPQHETVYCDGSEHSARIVARRLINKMPHIQKGGYLFVHIIRDDDGDYFVGVSEQGEKNSSNIANIFSKRGYGEKEEAEFVEKARKLFKSDEESGNSHVAEPMARALDAVFGGNPVEQVENLISDTVKDGKEGGNE